MVDQGKRQVEIAEFFRVSKQAVNKRLKELRGRQTRVIVSKKIEKAVDSSFDAMKQLSTFCHQFITEEDSPEGNDVPNSQLFWAIFCVMVAIACANPLVSFDFEAPGSEGFWRSTGSKNPRM